MVSAEGKLKGQFGVHQKWCYTILGRDYNELIAAASSLCNKVLLLGQVYFEKTEAVNKLLL